MSLNLNGNILRNDDITSTGVFKSKINMQGLLLYLDAANINSYPGSNSIWYDLSDYGNIIYIIGSPSWTTLNGRKTFSFLSDGDYMSGSTSNFPTTVLTLEAWIYPGAAEITAGDRGTVILCNGGSGAYMSWNKSNQYMSNYWYGHTPQGYHESNGPSSRSTWHHWVCVWDNKNVYQWVDGTMGQVSNVTGTSTTNPYVLIGREGSSRQFSGGISIVRIYDRALSPYEVAENFNAERERFGI
jgi:hypothetical protein